MTTQTKKLIAVFVVMAITMFAIIKANAEVYPKSKFADLCEVITTPEYNKAVDEYAKLVDEYDSKADEYLANPTEEGYKELNKLQMNLFSTEEFKEYEITYYFIAQPEWRLVVDIKNPLSLGHRLIDQLFQRLQGNSG